MNHELHESGEPILALCSDGFDRFFFVILLHLQLLIQLLRNLQSVRKVVSKLVKNACFYHKFHSFIVQF